MSRARLEGALVPREGWNRAPESPFVLRGTDLELRSDSVSSEWTSESDPEDTPQGEKRRRKVRSFRVSHRLDSDSGSGGSSSSSSGSSSSTSSGSSSASGGEVARQKKQRKQMMAEWEQHKANGTVFPGGLVAGADGQRAGGGDADVPMAPAPSPVEAPPPVPRSREPATLEWHDSGKRYRCFAVARGFLSHEDMLAIHSTAQHPTVKEINDRKGYLAFKHRVWRFEPQLRVLHPDLYRRLLELMHQADAAKWRRLRRNSKKKKKVYPEIEYISYDVAEQGQPCYIEPHVDNKSAVSMVAMLSTGDAYVGGRSCFRRAEGKDGCRELCLKQGDLVLFRGEKLTHWITPVTAGKRVILQIELSRV